MDKGNKVILEIDKTITMLAGYPYGQKVYNEQFKDKVDIYREFTIEFPKQVKKIASSFVQGFFKEIVESIGIQGVEERLIIISGKEELKESIIKDLM